MNQTAKEKEYSAYGRDAEEKGNVVAFRMEKADAVETLRRLYFGDKLQLLTVMACDERRDGAGFKVCYLFGLPGGGEFIMPYVIAENGEFPSVTKDIHEASGYERKIMSFFGLTPVGHPHARAMLLHENWPADAFPLRKDFDGKKRPPEAKGAYEFQTVEGEGIYEIPVGPVHAGIIEPGHFRFSMAGEEVVNLEPKLGYKHKGVEKLFETLPLADKLRLSERVSGDTSFTHSLAFCQALETLGGIEAPERAKFLRVIFSELERLAAHFNDFGFVLSDTGFSFGGANGTRLRETVMQWNERLTGSRFLRGVNAIGGVNKDISAADAEKLAAYLKHLRRDFEQVVAISLDSTTADNRLEGTGRLDHQIAADHGVMGIAGRAVGIARDARVDYPYAAYGKLKFKSAHETEGDVKARLKVRITEARASIGLIEEALKGMPSGEIKSSAALKLPADSMAVGISEAWRGTVVYTVMTDKTGEISRVDVRDPSFINWTVVGHAGKGNIVPDFPLINKSFNLSYSGNDL